MTDLNIQRLKIENCESRIEKEYFWWGRGQLADATEATWDVATPAQRTELKLRGYRIFDGYLVPQDNELTPADICLTIAINSYVVLPDVRRFMSRAEDARPLFETLPANLDLEDASENHIKRVAELIDLFHAPHVSLSKTTKVLYKKRPRLIPLIDSYVRDCLKKQMG